MSDDKKDENEPSEEETDEVDSGEAEDDSPAADRRSAASEGAASTEEVKTLGLQRWVQFAFVGVAILTFFVTDKLITLIWDYFAEPLPLVCSAAGAVVGALTGLLLYRHSKVKTLADEVAGELSKVTWPSRQETWYSTVVVIVTSIIAAAYLGVFDALWSAFTDYVYSL